MNEVLSDNQIQRPFVWPPTDFQELQDVVRRYAPNPYYDTTYSHHERQYLPTLFAWLSDRPRKRVLEIGPGWGTTMAWLAANGWSDITVMDIMPRGHWITDPLLELTGARYVQHDICSGPLEEQFDLIIMTQVIGHLKFSPLQALAHVRQMMASDGLLIASIADEADHPNLRDEAHFGNDWRAVPFYGAAPPDPDIVQTSYDADSFGALMRAAFDHAWIWKPPGIVVFGEAHRDGEDES